MGVISVLMKPGLAGEKVEGRKGGVRRGKKDWV